jgi:hypothetical protein
VKLVAQALLAAATPVGVENVLTGLNCSELHRRDLINQTNQQLETTGHETCRVLKSDRATFLAAHSVAVLAGSDALV